MSGGCGFNEATKQDNIVEEETTRSRDAQCQGDSKADLRSKGCVKVAITKRARPSALSLCIVISLFCSSKQGLRPSSSI